MKLHINFNCHLLFAVLLLVLCPVNAQSQSFEEYRQRAHANFQNYKQTKVSEFQAYRAKKNAEMEEYIRKAWKEMPEHTPKPKPYLNDDDVKPVVIPDDINKIPKDNPIIPDEIIEDPIPQPIPEPVAPIEEVPIKSEKYVAFTLYGTDCKVRFDVNKKPILRNSSEEAIADMWHTLCSREYDNLFFDCISIRKELNICDWAYVKLAESLSIKIYGSSRDNNAIVFQSVVLLQSGFKLVMGRSEDSSIHLLLASDCDMYGYPYYEINGEHFYLLDGSNVDKMYFMTELPDNLKQMRLAVVSENKFTPKQSKSRTLSARKYPEATANVSGNENLIAFYNDYPESYVNNDSKTRWRFYAQAPLNQTAKSTLYPALRKAISGKTKLEAANILLNFVQTAFVYEYDDVVWGRDRAFFPDESLYYPYCDCEDRAILFSRLVRDLLRQDVVLVYYPGHLATAVHFDEDIAGDYLMVKGKKYTICDPTIIGYGAPVGITMKDMDNGKAVVIEL